MAARHEKALPFRGEMCDGLQHVNWQVHEKGDRHERMAEHLPCEMWRKNADCMRHSPARSDQKDPGLSRHPVQTAANFPCSIGKRHERFYQLIYSADGTSGEAMRKK
jgi:hypothetical protein